MRDKRTFIACAKILPYKRKCAGCRHSKSCALYYKGDFEADNHEDKAMSMFADDKRQGIMESFVLETGAE